MSSLVVVVNPKQFSRSRAAFALSQLLDILGYLYSFSDDGAELSPGSTSQSPRLSLYYGPPDHVPPRADIVIPEQSDAAPADLLAALGDPDPAHHVQSTVDPGDRRFWTYDLIQAAFYLLSRQEEVDVSARDAMDRFSTEHSLLSKLGLVERPVLNEAALILDGLIQQVAAERRALVLKKSPWPHPYRYAVSLTHDIDDLGYRDPAFGLHCLGQFVRTRRFYALRKGLGTLLQWGQNRLTGRDYARWYLDEWLRLEDERGLRSTCYLVSAGNDKSSYDPNYDVAEMRLSAQLRSMAKRGWEIGVHGSFDSYRSAQRTRAELQRLQDVLSAPVHGIRQHYLRLAVPDTWTYQEMAGYRYDATLGFRDRLGFRAGLTTPFTPYNLLADAPFSLLELPLSIMDGVLFWRYKLAPEAALSTVLDYAGLTRDVQGHLTLLWHHYAFDARKCPGWWSVYQEIVLHLAQQSAVYIATMADVVTWWQARQHLTLAADTLAGDSRRVVLRAGRAIPGHLRLDIGGGGWRLTNLSDGELILPYRPELGRLALILLPPVAESQTITLEFERETRQSG